MRKSVCGLHKASKEKKIFHLWFHPFNLASNPAVLLPALEEVLKNSDFITLHLPLTVETKYIINETNILLLKRGSFLVNTARGGLVKTEAIIMALNEGVLAGAALDVLEEEKELSEEVAILTSEFRDSVDLKNLVYNHILINHPKVLITPHNAFNSEEALDRITKTTINNINSFMKGNPINLID